MKYFIPILFLASVCRADVTVTNMVPIECGDDSFRVSFMANGDHNLTTPCMIRKDATAQGVRGTVEATAIAWEDKKAEANMDAIRTFLSGKTWVVTNK